MKPGGEIVLVNHIGAEEGPRSCSSNGSRRLRGDFGWRPEFRFGRLTGWAAGHGGVRVIEHRPMPPLGHFSLIRFQRLEAGSRKAA